MQRVVVSPPDQGDAEQSVNLIRGLGHTLHWFTNKIPQTFFLIPPFFPLLRNGTADLIDQQPHAPLFIPLSELLHQEFVFQVDENLTSSATRVMFNNSDQTRQQICLKMWLHCYNDLYQTEDFTKQTTFLLEGLAFNRQFSEDIYYGIVPVLFDSLDRVKCGPLIENPTFEKLAFNRPYALVMKRLQEEWRLDHQLRADQLGSISGIEFLAYQIARMHTKLDRSLSEFGTPERIGDKLSLNTEQFLKALVERRNNPQIMANSNFSEANFTWIESAPVLLRQISKTHMYDFKKRRREGHIRRCHGDFKAANLWICPSRNESQTEKRLVALDCVDFNPDFCNIDTLSDVAMLAIDLEMRLENSNYMLSGKQLTRHFLQTYLKAVGEHESVWPLLEYYMTEKAMVCAYMSILYDGLPTLGEKYLKVVLRHSQELARYLPPHMSKRITRPLRAASAVATSRHG